MAPATKKKAFRADAWKTGRVTVEVLRGRGLLAVDRSGSSDPFVTVQFVSVAERKPLPKPLDVVVKTSVKKQTLEPSWTGERFVFNDVGAPLPYARPGLDQSGQRRRRGCDVETAPRRRRGRGDSAGASRRRGLRSGRSARERRAAAAAKRPEHRAAGTRA